MSSPTREGARAPVTARPSAAQRAATLARARQRARQRHGDQQRPVGLVGSSWIARPVEADAGIDPEQESPRRLQLGLANEQMLLARRPAPVDALGPVFLPCGGDTARSSRPCPTRRVPPSRDAQRLRHVHESSSAEIAG